MKQLETHVFVPDEQPEGGGVEFDLRPIDMPTLWKWKSAIASSSLPDWETMRAVVNNVVVGWRGLPDAYSAVAKAELLDGPGSDQLVMWVMGIVKDATSRAMLTGDQRKN